MEDYPKYSAIGWVGPTQILYSVLRLRGPGTSDLSRTGLPPRWDRPVASPRLADGASTKVYLRIRRPEPGGACLCERYRIPRKGVAAFLLRCEGLRGVSHRRGVQPAAHLQPGASRPVRSWFTRSGGRMMERSGKATSGPSGVSGELHVHPEARRPGHRPDTDKTGVSRG